MEAEGRPLPLAYLDRPLLLSGTEFLWDAFWELSTDRPLGFGGEGRIPSMAIRAFAADHDLTGDDLAWFLAVMREMDAEYLGMRVPKQAADLKMTDHQGVKSLLRRLSKPLKPEPGREDAVA